MSFGERLKEARLMKGYTQKQLIYYHNRKLYSLKGRKLQSISSSICCFLKQG